MANNYLQFSESLENLTDEEKDWLEYQIEDVEITLPHSSGDPEDAYHETVPRFMQELELCGTAYEFCPVGVSYELERNRDLLWVYSEESGDPEEPAKLVQAFLKKFRPNDYWSLSYAYTCSKLRIGEFGGGAVFVTADKIKFYSSDNFIGECAKKFEDEKIDAMREQQELETKSDPQEDNGSSQS